MAQRPTAPPPCSAATTQRDDPEATVHWTTVFLSALADTSNVAAAARKAAIDVSTAYHRRRHDHEFNRNWQVALSEGYDNLEMELLYRLRSGELKPASGTKRAVRSFDNATAFRLLAVHRESAARERARRDHTSAEEIRAAIDRKVEELRQRVMDAKARREAGTPGTASLPKPLDPA
ncbi:hypothetical protein [Novosphingobium sp.]|uniref:hypothetical protein n=1 Tax=Novosphingobium sp. TaxID=1874826 RepID=UPI0026304161|nr:hypothetical protein [Novosphingobium sp.]